MIASRSPSNEKRMNVDQADGARGARHDGGIVRGEEERRPALHVHPRQEVDDRGGGARVQVRGGLVGQDGQRLVDERAGQGDPLPLAAGELVRAVPHAVVEPHRRQRRLRPPLAVGAGDPVDPERILHVLERGEHRQEVEGLEHEAQLAPPQARLLRRGQGGQIGAREQDLALVRLVQAAEQVQQARLAAAGRARHHHELALRHLDVDAAQRLDDDVAEAIPLAQVAGLEEHSRGYREPGPQPAGGAPAQSPAWVLSVAVRISWPSGPVTVTS